MKGQAQIFGIVAVVTVVVVMTLIGLTIYGLVANVYPHDQLVNNETLCTTCVNGSTSGTATTYAFDNIPILNDSILICFNDSSDLMTNGVIDPVTCLGYNIGPSNAVLNITNTSAGAGGCQISNVVCTYTFDEANSQEQAFFDSNTSITFGGFELLSIAGIVIAGVAIIMLVLFLKD